MNAAPTIVAFVGIDGAGKTTQAQRLVAALAQDGTRVRFVPNRTLRRLRGELDAIAHERGAADLFAYLGKDAARLALALPKWHAFDQVFEDARPGEVLVFDRYIHCQLAHARYREVSNVWLHERLFRMFPAPDVAIYMDIDPAIAAARVAARGVDHVPAESLARLQACYEALADAPTFARLDASASADALEREILALIRPQLANSER